MLVKQAIDVAFAEGLDTKTDPKRVQMGKFLRLENSVFDKGGLLKKRNGFGNLTALPDANYTSLTTFNGNLTAIGRNIAARNSATGGWVEKGDFQPLSLKTLPMIRNNLNQIACDAALSPSGLVCTAYLESNGSTTTNKYAIADSVTGQNLVAPRAIPVTSGTVSGGMRVFYLGNHFVIVFTNTITAVDHLQYIAISAVDPTNVSANTDIAANYTPQATLSWDGYVVGNRLYLAYNTLSGGQAMKVTYLTSSFDLASAVTFAGFKASMVSVTADMTIPASPVVYVSFYSSMTSNLFTLALDTNLGTLTAPQLIDSGTFLNLATAAKQGVCYQVYEVSNNYAYDASIPSHYISSNTLTGSTVGTPSVTVRSVGLASKVFIVDSVLYFLAVYQSPYQPTYFLVNAANSTASAPSLAAKMAYENAGGYLTLGLPGVSLDGTTALFPYLFKDLIQAVNKNTNVPTGTQVNGIYSQTGINLATFEFSSSALITAEIGSNLNLGGGFLWMYDGYLPVEQGFFLWPDSIEVTTSTGSGDLTAQDYFYQVTYEWTDNQGNAFRSAPSIPVKQTTTTSSSTNTIKVPTLRLTMKTANPVKIVLYRWSTAQQNYFQVTSIATPTLNSTTTDVVTITDTSSDSAILGNNLIYTTGGVLENIAAPAANILALFDTRLWLVDSEDKNLLWYSKQVIEATPVEMSDLLTFFIPPTVGTATGVVTALHPMDDKLIVSKGGDSLVYINGSGPDNTGANNQYSQPVFITSTVGSSNQKSMVLIPSGLMFESNKGIWLLDRGLNTSYIGAPVEDFTTGATVVSAIGIPGTNQVRFALDSGVTLMYDYFYNQWASFTGIPLVSSTIFQDLEVFINSRGAVYQETPGAYLDGSSPVLMRFKTGPLRVGDLQNYQRAYFFYILGQYISPHKLVLSMAYDYSNTPSQQVVITPTNYSTPYGSGASQSPYGQGTPFGGPSNLELWRVFLERQRCMAFSIELQEVFDPSFGTVAGAGLTISGLNVVCAFKKGFRPQEASNSAG